MNSIHHRCVVQVIVLSSIDTLHCQVTRLLDSYLAAWTMDKVAIHGVYRWYPALSCSSPCPQYLNVASLVWEYFGFTYNYSRYVCRIEAEVRGNANMECRISHNLYSVHCTTIENIVRKYHQRNYSWHSKPSASRPFYRVWVLTCCTLPIIDHEFSVRIGAWAPLG